MHACDKTIEESKEMIITEVRIMVTSEKEGKSCVEEGQQGTSAVLAMLYFLTWMVAWRLLL